MTNIEKEELLREFIEFASNNSFTKVEYLILNGKEKSEKLLQEFLNQPVVYKGKDVLKLKKGTFVQVVSHYSNDSINDILIRILNKENFFVNIQTGTLWGDSIENYTFKEVKKEDVLNIKI